jgi:predicted GTPase
MKYPVKYFAKSMTDNPPTYLLVLVNSATASNMWHVFLMNLIKKESMVWKFTRIPVQLQHRYRHFVLSIRIEVLQTEKIRA